MQLHSPTYIGSEPPAGRRERRGSKLRSRLVGAWILAGVACALLAGCKSSEGPDFSKDPLEQAREVTRLKKEAEYHWLEFQRSNGQDLSALEKYEAAHRATTKVAPTSCARCYMNHGAALARLGLYYATLIDLRRREAVGAKEAELAQIESKIAEYTAKAKEYFRESVRQFEVYYRSGDSIDPETYIWVFRQYAALGEYDQALYYLDLYVANVTLTETGTENVEQLRRDYRRQQQIAQERAFEEELRDELGGFDPFGVVGDADFGN